MVKNSFKIDFQILKGLKTSLEVKILKNDKTVRFGQLPLIDRIWWSTTPDQPNVLVLKKIKIKMSHWKCQIAIVTVSSVQSTTCTDRSTKNDRFYA